jgi:hypothetical protein
VHLHGLGEEDDVLGAFSSNSDETTAWRSLPVTTSSRALAWGLYQAGMNPPRGVWLENQQSSSGSLGHNLGDPILLNTNDKRYISFYLNSTTFMPSIVVILMVWIKALLKRNALHSAMIFDLFGLMGAYIAGSSRSLRPSIHVIVLATSFLVYVTEIYLHVKMTSTPNTL